MACAPKSSTDMRRPRVGFFLASFFVFVTTEECPSNCCAASLSTFGLQHGKHANRDSLGSLSTATLICLVSVGVWLGVAAADAAAIAVPTAYTWQLGLERPNLLRPN